MPYTSWNMRAGMQGRGMLWMKYYTRDETKWPCRRQKGLQWVKLGVCSPVIVQNNSGFRRQPMQWHFPWTPVHWNPLVLGRIWKREKNSKTLEIRLSWWPERVESLDKGKEFCEITKNFCVLHIQSNTTVFHLKVQYVNNYKFRPYRLAIFRLWFNLGCVHSNRVESSPIRSSHARKDAAVTLWLMFYVPVTVHRE